MGNRPAGPRWVALVGGILTAIGLAPFGAGQPWVSSWVGNLAFFGPLVAIFGLAVAIHGASQAFRQCRESGLGLAGFSVALVALALVSLIPTVQIASWRLHFALTRQPREATIRWVQAQGTPTQTRGRQSAYALPRSLRSMAENGQAVCYRHESGDRWIFLPRLTCGIDDTVGYAWSERETPPPPEAFPTIVRSQALGNGWYVFWST